MKVLHILSGGKVGGIETLCLNYAMHSSNENAYLILWDGGKVSDEMASRGFKVEVFHSSPKKYFMSAIRFIKLCKKERIEAVIFHVSYPLSAICAIFVRIVLPKVHLFAYAHSNPVDWRKRDIISARFIYKHAEKIVCISDSVKNSVRELVGYGDRLVKIYNGIDTGLFYAKGPRTFDGIVNLIYVGRLERVKGVQNILNALSKVNDIDYRFKIVGDGSFKQELMDLTENYGMKDRVEFCGTRRDIPKLLHQSDIFIHMPDCQEGFGITVIEAMATGKICIVNDHGALPEIVTDQVNGFVIGGERDFRETLEGIFEALKGGDQSGLLSGIREKSIARAADFSIEKYTKDLDGLISGSCTSESL